MCAAYVDADYRNFNEIIKVSVPQWDENIAGNSENLTFFKDFLLLLEIQHFLPEDAILTRKVGGQQEALNPVSNVAVGI